MAPLGEPGHVIMDVPPQIWLPEKPAIIRPDISDLNSFFPVRLSREERRIVIAELRRANRTVSGMVIPIIGIRQSRPSVVPITVAYAGKSGINDPGFVSSANVTGVPIGAANASRYVLVFFSNENSGFSTTTVTSVTIGGIGATIWTTGTNQYAIYSGQGHGFGVFCGAVVPTGTTATVAITWSSSDQRRGITCFAYTMYGADTSSLYASATTVKQTTGANTGLSGSCDVPNGGVLFAGYGVGTQNVSSPTMSGVTKDDQDLNVGSDDSSAMAGSYQPSSDQSSFAFGAAHGSTNSWGILNGIAFKPA